MKQRPATLDEDNPLAIRERARLETLVAMRGRVTRLERLSDDELRDLLRDDAAVSVGRLGASIDEPEAE